MDNKWIKKAILLGLSFFIAILLVKPVGVSTQFSVISGMIHSSIDKDVIVENPERDSGYESTNAYYDKDEGKLAKSIKEPLNYSFVFFLSIPLGGFLASKLAHRNQPKEEKIYIKGRRSFKSYLPQLISGFLLLFGARMAGGCTSGHMMSGIMQGSVSGLIFAAAVFVVAIPVAIYSVRRTFFRGGK